MSKGSTPRPYSVSNEEYRNRWDAIFGHDGDSSRTIHEPKKPGPPSEPDLKVVDDVNR